MDITSNTTMMNRLVFLLCFSLNASALFAQTATITGKVEADNKALGGAQVILKGASQYTLSKSDGSYQLTDIAYGTYTIAVLFEGKKTIEQQLIVNASRVELSFVMEDFGQVLDEVLIQDQKEEALSLARLRAIENFGIYEGKKNEVILVSNLIANLATNNPRQIYSHITGLNIWESDGVGLQLGIGGRGLSPNRTSSFNTRQNGYDISADALGYPESYYTPTPEALDRIEVIRGAASLQYGTQFGGMLNFRFKQGPRDKKIELISRQTIGSWNFLGTFNSLGGTVANGKLNYYTYYQYKTGNGYRPNSDFDYHNAFVSLNYQATQKLLVNFDFTHMNYQAHQPGGLTDKMFEDNPDQSVRARNWFDVNWNLFALNFTYVFNPKTQLNIRNFGLIARRESLGNLERINVADNGGNRTLINGEFRNVGNETRLLHRYQLGGNTHAFVAGFRLYNGFTVAKQGEGNNGSGPDFYFLNPDDVEGSDYRFPNRNYSAFIESVINISDKFSITPGVRFENIQTFSEGYYKQRVYDGAGNIVVENKIDESLERKRSFVIGGIGLSYKISDHTELYGNISQNYRAINFTDLRIQNPNFTVDPNIKDENGFTADLGIRGTASGKLSYEVTGFYVAYNDRIGQVLRADQPPLYNDYRYRGNIADARIFGVEAFAELNLAKYLQESPKYDWVLFVNTAVIDARYIHTEDNSIRNRQVEMVPPVMIRSGTSVKYRSWGAAIQFGYTGTHYSDASNAKRTATAVEGEIPAYGVMDLSLNYTWKWLRLEGNCNNMLNEKYFTRRAESYPGPGIIPSDPRGFYLTAQLKI
jgi:Fe(3+) dicitrate transport protein